MNAVTKPSKNIGFLPYHLDTEPLVLQLKQNPELWNQYTGRLNHPESPHRETDDIWLRYAQENIDRPDFKVTGPHKSMWFPASRVLSAAKILALQLFDLAEGKEFGGSLIIRVPPGKKVYPHVDRGWHAEYYEKIVVQIAGDRETEFAFEDGGLNPVAGEVYWADNHDLHWLTNNSSQPWINLTVNYRR